MKVNCSPAFLWASETWQRRIKFGVEKVMEQHFKIVSADQENKRRCGTIPGGCEQKITSALQENIDD